MTKLQTGTITLVVAAVGFFSLQTLEAKKQVILHSLALSIMSSLIEIETAGIETAEKESKPAEILIADSTHLSPTRTTPETIAALVLPLPALKALPKPLCNPQVKLASYRTDLRRFRYELVRPQTHTEIRVVSAASAQTGDWAKLIASCREKSLKVCVERSKSSHRVVILDPSGIEAPPSTFTQPGQPFS